MVGAYAHNLKMLAETVTRAGKSTVGCWTVRDGDEVKRMRVSQGRRGVPRVV